MTRPYRWLFFLAGGCVFVVEMVTGPELVHWGLGLTMGAIIGLWVDFNDSPPPYIENWRRGAHGERQTARVLRRLRRRGWRCAHDLETPRGNRDHVAVGPGGVFLLETKRPQGEVSVDHDCLWVRRFDDPDAAPYGMPQLARRLRAEASQLSSELASDHARGPWVQGVVVIWAPFPQRVIELNRVVYVHGDELRTWLESRPDQLDPALVKRLFASVGRRVVTPGA